MSLDQTDRMLRDAAERLETLAAVFEVRGSRGIADELAATALQLYGDIGSPDYARACNTASAAIAQVAALDRVVASWGNGAAAA